MPPARLMILLLSMAGPVQGGEKVDYLRDVKPIFSRRCYACHAALKQQSGLRLDTAVALRQGGDSGPAVEPGKSADSLLVAAVTGAGGAVRMPPEGEGGPLDEEEIATLKTWIDQGADGPADEAPQADPRAHWSFQRVVRSAAPVAVPTAAGLPHAVRNPIDAFLARAHDRHQLTPAPEAAKSTLLRRVYLDLIGLPPTLDELHSFLADDSTDAYEKVVDRLLESPQHGQRWARHWMDIWRYADWYGRRHVPDVWNSAPQIWRWRDWIVRSLNDDHGYDRMLREMLAADEICPEDSQAVVATGYLIRNWYALNPNDWMRSTVEHTGKAFLGLTFNCAHCHDHKYDPITQDDYFRLRACFEPIGIRQDRVAGEADPGPFEEYSYSKLRKIQRLGAVRIFDKNIQATTWFYTGGDERNRMTERGSIAPGVPVFLTGNSPPIAPVELPPRAWYPGLRPEIQQTVLAEAKAAVAAAEAALAGAKGAGGAPLAAAEARAVSARAELAGVEARIAADRAQYGETPGADAAELARAAGRLEREAAVRKAEADVAAGQRVLAEAEAKPATAADRGKEIESANKLVAEARAAVDKAQVALADETLAQKFTGFSPVYARTSSGRRRALAEWITGRDNPLTSRVAVNHIWGRHFHAPLVASVYDFGHAGALPTHPELLDWLAAELMESDWSMKHLHRLIVTSAAYRRASWSESAAGNAGKDPENKMLWRMNTGRMESEVVRDSLLYCAGRLDLGVGGQELENSEALTTFRRSLYYAVYPEQGGKSALGELFDAPDALDCYRRTRSIVPQQALALTNSELVHAMSAAIAKDCPPTDFTAAAQGAPPDSPNEPMRRFVSEAFERILSRAPSDAEWRLCDETYERQRELAARTDAAQAAVRARESIIRALLNHNDFITIR